jgi:hypothetical protein
LLPLRASNKIEKGGGFFLPNFRSSGAIEIFRCNKKKAAQWTAFLQ